MFDHLLDELTKALPSPTATLNVLVDSAAMLHRLESAVSARKHAVVANLFSHYDANPVSTDNGISLIDPWDALEAELGPALTITPYAASALISLGVTLATRLPNVAAAYATGDLDFARVKAIVDATQNVADEHIKEVERRTLVAALDGKAPLFGRRLRDAVNKAITIVDAAGLRRRREAKKAERHIWVGNAADGMAELSGSLSGEDAMFLTNRLGEMAKRVCADDPRLFQARRADALMALVRGKAELDCLCGKPECVFRGDVLGTPSRHLVHVIATEATLDGTSEDAAWIDGFGWIDAEQLREIAELADIRKLQDPSAVVDGYRPTTALSDWVRAVHGSCQFPGCDRPAWESDLDHREPHGDGGETSAANLGPFCRKHHRGKTFGKWELVRDEDGCLTIKSPLGRVYPIPPTGPVPLLGGTALARDQNPTPPKRKKRTRKQQRADRTKKEREGNSQPPPS